MDNVKVNYIGKDGNRTSTTLNGLICWAYFKTTDAYKSSIDMAFIQNARQSLVQEVQNYVNNLKLSGGQCLTKNIIEDLLLYTIMDERFEAGYAAALSNQEQPF